MEAGVAVVDERCTACSACLDVCPVEALSLPASPVVAAPSDARGVWVWVEQAEGKAHSISWEMMGQGRHPADALQVRLTGCVPGASIGEIVAEAAVFTEGDPKQWETIIALGNLPVFTKDNPAPAS